MSFHYGIIHYKERKGDQIEMKEVQLHHTYEETCTVTKDMLACNVGSGIVSVLATPMMIAKMEHAALECLAPFLEEGETSVGVMMNSTHDAATPCGMNIVVSAKIVAIDRKKISFEIIARDDQDQIGKASHDRFVVNKERFEQKAQAKLD